MILLVKDGFITQLVFISSTLPSLKATLRLCVSSCKKSLRQVALSEVLKSIATLVIGWCSFLFSGGQS